MKWLPFFITLIMVNSCILKKGKVLPATKDTVTITETEEMIVHGRLVPKMPWDTREDSGYFRGYQPDSISLLEEAGTSQLDVFLKGLIDKREIVLLNRETLSHSVLIDQTGKKRYDTLKNKYCSITSIYNFRTEESQEIKFNGKPFKKVAGPEGVYNDETILDFNNSSFRYFSFKGNKFYYIRAHFMDGRYGSIHTITYHLIYNLQNMSVSCFETCRYSPILFGDVDGDDRLDYLEFENSDFCTGVPSSDRATIFLYSCNEKGEFVLRKGKGNEPYYIEGNTGANYTQDSFIVKKANWIRPLP
jgi:hypothetical protein